MPPARASKRRIVAFVAFRSLEEGQPALLRLIEQTLESYARADQLPPNILITLSRSGLRNGGLHPPYIREKRKTLLSVRSVARPWASVRHRYWTWWDT